MIAVMISTILVMNKILGVHLAMVAYTKPQQRKKEESERLRGERDGIKFNDLRFKRRQVLGFRKARRQDAP